MNLEQLQMMLKRLHRIPRFNSYFMLKPKSVLEHSARVAAIYAYLGGKELLPALLHDLSEAFLGFDPPSPIKAEIPEIKAFELKPLHVVPFESEQEKALCKVCDGIELIIDLKEQQQLGNRDPELLEIYDSTLEEVMERAKKINRKAEVQRLIKALS